MIPWLSQSQKHALNHWKHRSVRIHIQYTYTFFQGVCLSNLKTPITVRSPVKFREPFPNYVDVYMNVYTNSWPSRRYQVLRSGTSSTRSLVQTSPPCFSTAFTKASTTEPMPPWRCRSGGVKPVGGFMSCTYMNLWIYNVYNCLHLCGFLSSLHRCMDFGGCQMFVFCCICTVKTRIMKHREKEKTSISRHAVPHIFFTTKKTFANCGNPTTATLNCWPAMGYGMSSKNNSKNNLHILPLDLCWFP